MRVVSLCRSYQVVTHDVTSEVAVRHEWQDGHGAVVVCYDDAYQTEHVGVFEVLHHQSFLDEQFHHLGLIGLI